MKTEQSARNELQSVASIKPEDVSDLGARVAALLSDLFVGLYHIPRRSLRRTDWTNRYYIEFVTDVNLATFDVPQLTRLVFLAHDYCVRVDVQPASPRYFRLVFHRRQRNGSIFERHPTIEQAVSDWRRHHTVDDEEVPE